MSDVAASGGYYIASGATKIFAHEDTLTGSIGVVGGKIAPGGALAKLGVNTFPMGRGKRATMMASLAPWNAEEKAVIQALDGGGLRRRSSAASRRAASKKLEDVQPIAQGRVWTGTKAKELGLVDEIGGLDAALAEARKLAKLDATTGLEVYPPAPTLRDVFSSFGQVQAPFGLQLDDAIAGSLAALATIDPLVAVGDRAARQARAVVPVDHDPGGRGGAGGAVTPDLATLRVSRPAGRAPRRLPKARGVQDPAHMRKLRVLVAEDDAELLDVVAGVIERFGAEVTRAVTGHELLSTLAEGGHFDFVVTDVSMPWMTGLQVMHSTQAAGLPVPVIVMTALRIPRSSRRRRSSETTPPCCSSRSR